MYQDQNIFYIHASSAISIKSLLRNTVSSCDNPEKSSTLSKFWVSNLGGGGTLCHFGGYSGHGAIRRVVLKCTI
jgi:hypothetical protein